MAVDQEDEARGEMEASVLCCKRSQRVRLTSLLCESVVGAPALRKRAGKGTWYNNPQKVRMEASSGHRSHSELPL
jgi:hypothetical protein